MAQRFTLNRRDVNMANSGCMNMSKCDKNGNFILFFSLNFDDEKRTKVFQFDSHLFDSIKYYVSQ